MTVGSVQPRYISLRWRLLLPIFIVLLIVVMAGAYALGQSLTQAAAAPQINLLFQTGNALRNRSNDLYEQMRLEAQRVAFTRGVADAVRSRTATDLQPILESSARLANLDSIIVTDAQGIEVAGVFCVWNNRQNIAYTISTDTDLHVQSVVRAVLDEHTVGATGLLRTPSGLVLYTAVPLLDADQTIGVVLVGRSLDNVLIDLKADDMADLALYGSDAALLQTTTRPVDTTASELTLSPDDFQTILAAPNQLTLRPLQLDNQAYQAAYAPFQFGPQPLGVIGLFLLDSVPAIAQNRPTTWWSYAGCGSGCSHYRLIYRYLFLYHPSGSTGNRGCSITGDRQFLRPYRNAAYQ